MEPWDLSGWGRYEAGRGPAEVARERGLDPDELIVLSSNENAHGPSPMAVEAIRAAAERAHRYPKSAHGDLTERLAERWAVDPAQVWLGAGGVGGLDYLCRALVEPGDGVLVSTPGFPYHAKGAQVHNATVREYALPKARGFELHAESLLETYAGERIVYLTRPHNPTGRWVPIDVIETVVEETGPRDARAR